MLAPTHVITDRARLIAHWSAGEGSVVAHARLVAMRHWYTVRGGHASVCRVAHRHSACRRNAGVACPADGATTEEVGGGGAVRRAEAASATREAADASQSPHAAAEAAQPPPVAPAACVKHASAANIASGGGSC